MNFEQPPVPKQESVEEKLEKRREELRKTAEDILRQAKERQDWVKDWTPEEDENFIVGYIKTFEGIESMPEKMPAARIRIGGFDKVGFEWTDDNKDLGITPSRKFE